MESVCGPRALCVGEIEQRGAFRKLWWGVISIWTWLEIALVTILGMCLQALVALATCRDPTRQRAGRWFRDMSVLAVKLAPTWHFRVHGAYPKKLDPPTVVVSNHLSLADPFLISHLPWEMKWLGKASLLKTPFLGWSMRLAGDIALERGTSSSVSKAMARCAEYLEMGMSVCIFPEGTRSKSESLLPFKDGAFRLAIETQTDILPLAVRGTEVALPKHSWLFGAADAAVIVGERIPTKGLTLSDLETLKASTRAAIEALRAQIRLQKQPS